MKSYHLRRTLHIAGVSIILCRTFSGINFTLTLIFSLSLLYIICEYCRLKNLEFPLCRLSKMAVREKQRMDVKPLYYACSISFALIVFPENIGNASIVILTIGDGLAGYIGTLIGKHPLPINRTKTYEGSIFGFTIAFIIAAYFTPMLTALLGAIIGGISEASNIFLDDNLSVPIFSGLIMLFVSI